MIPLDKNICLTLMHRFGLTQVVEARKSRFGCKQSKLWIRNQILWSSMNFNFERPSDMHITKSQSCLIFRKYSSNRFFWEVLIVHQMRIQNFPHAFACTLVFSDSCTCISGHPVIACVNMDYD